MRYAEYDFVKLNQAFKLLRKRGFIARQNYSCCGGCAGAGIASDVGDKLKKLWETRGPVAAKRAYDKVKGAVFYHRQDMEHLEKSGRVMIRYGQVGVHGVGDVGIDSVEVGFAVINAMNEAGLTCDWDGDASKCIEVDARTLRQVARDAEQAEKERARAARWERHDFEVETGYALVPMGVAS